MKTVVALSGAISTIDIKAPELPAGHVLIRTEYSAISPGTELTMARKSKDVPVGLGYSAVGLIERTAPDIVHLKPGDRVACYGGPYVRHAELLAVPANLTALVPAHVRPEEAAFAGLGAIAIHALRVAQLQFGESAVIVGLGILGNLIAQIAEAASYVTFGLDLQPARVRLMQDSGLSRSYDSPELLERELQAMTDGRGADSVLLCASGIGEALLNQSLDWIRDRGSIVIVGDGDVALSREKMFSKEARVLISRAGGPGRYDAGYERDNRDYPLGFVRWTEGRNTREYIRLLAEGRINVQPLISGIYPLAQAEEAYRQYAQPNLAMGTLLKYQP
ncbi:Threonine dehydrogenase [Paenibacillus sp. UNCCL117]|uniref:zinc-dependent alcohol dehydrogenase n=1 Tax=unclassified Paenibacillus TaxID=185978 RepID=UPI0008822F40|nr:MULTISPECIES: zinc-binding alcohol dehydrogenase [unclassified Paenibacillus]SDD11531.1 Threonine dehydrogenase [Paenibacillus sp. cl123]SFW33593.1 Threonine dehydrogenase [Paenibacillus sp. UNCCL117]